MRVIGSPGSSMSVMDVALAAHFKHGKTISGRGMYMKPKSDLDPETGAMDPDSTEAHACTVADVEVDTETGYVRVLGSRQRLRDRLRDQPGAGAGADPRRRLDGHVARLYETTAPYYPAIDHAPGDFNHYLMPGPHDLPEIDAIVLEMPSSNGPYGMKGVGEMTANPPIPAIVNAITDAIGVQITDLPITPEKVLRALESKEAA